MDIKQINAELSVSGQISLDDVSQLAQQQVKSIMCNRPEGESTDQISFQEIKQAAEAHGMAVVQVPVVSGKISEQDVAAFEAAWDALPKPAHLYCRTGTRSMTLWSLMQAKRSMSPDALISLAADFGYDLSASLPRFQTMAQARLSAASGGGSEYEVLIVGGGAAGISLAASLQKRRSGLSIAIVEPSDIHYYQPGFTMIGGGIFKPEQVRKRTEEVIPPGVKWIKGEVAAFEPLRKRVILSDGEGISYERLVVCPGLKLNWAGVKGLRETLGKNGVTSNYRPDLAPYTWELINGMDRGRALFTQPPMPIKCAGAPQKALYLAGDSWLRKGVLKDIEIEFCNAGGVLFGVKEYVPALQSYIDKYSAKLSFHYNLVSIDGDNRTATFDVSVPDAEKQTVTREFDMIHVCPPQIAPDFIRSSPLADAAGWVDVDPASMRHKTYADIWSLGDVTNTPNAKTAAAVRKQVPVVAENIIDDIDGRPGVAAYDGYGSCPLTVERGRIVLAEFAYGGKICPTFPRWMNEGTRPTRFAWFLKKTVLPAVYWEGMLKGHEWLTGCNAGED